MTGRYDRQERVKAIGKPGQTKIEAATILIAGVGALGTYAAEQLVRAGVTHLILVDPDVVSTTNLQRQTLFTEADVGTLKVDAAKAHLQAINSQVSILTAPQPLDRAFLDANPADLVLDCLDNYGTRDLINQAALAHQFDYIYASCAGTFGSVMAVSPTNHACLNCVYPNINELRQTDCDLIGVNTALVPLVSALQVSLALHYLVDKASVSFDQLITIDNWTMTQQTFTVNKDPNCAMCHRDAWPAEKVADDDTLKVLCGTQTYQANAASLPDLADLEQFLTQKKLPYKRFKAFVSFDWHGYTISTFKNHKLLLYGLPDLEAANALYRNLSATLMQEVTQP